MTRKLTLRIMLLTGLWGAYTSQTGAQKKRSMDQCMEYAICHAHRIQKGRVEAENAELNAERARGAFIPSLNAGVGGQLSWGRNVDPETNTNNTVTALNNSYEELQLAQDVVAKRRHWLRQEKLYAESLIPHEDYLRAEAEERRHIASMPGTKAERKDVSLVLADQACRNRRGEDHSSRSFFIGLPETAQKRVFDENRGVGNRQKAVFDAIDGRRRR